MNDRKKRLYAIILGGALTALATDKLMFGGKTTGPDEAAASERRARPAALSGVSGTATFAMAAGGTAIPELPFPRALPPYDPGIDRRDLFEMPAPIYERLWGKGTGGGRGPRGMRAEPELTGLERFNNAKHRLLAVLTYEGRAVAVVDDSRLREGDTLDECRLITIDPAAGRAEFACQDGNVALLVHPKSKPQG